MKYRDVITTCFLMILLFASCSKSLNSDSHGDDSIIIKVNTSIKLRDDVRLVIEECLKKYPQYNNFVLSRCPQKLVAVDVNEILSNDFLIGPAYALLDHDKAALLYFDFKGKRIFIRCGLEELYTDPNYQDSIYQNQLIKRGKDSIVEPDNTVIKNSAELYVYRSIYFKVGKDGCLFKSYRPDTLLLPQRGTSTVKFNYFKK